MAPRVLATAATLAVGSAAVAPAQAQINADFKRDRQTASNQPRIVEGRNGMEFVIVTYPTGRSVCVDGVPTGSTNDVIQMDAGTHVFDLGQPADYEPEYLEVVVNETSVLTPLRLVFARKEG